MKHSIRILLVYLISTTTSFACGWYPFGEDVRFSLLDPAYFDDGGMSPYYYNFLNYGESYESTETNDPNVALWNDYCGGKLDAKTVFDAVYRLSESEVESANSSNAMIQYLQKNDSEAIEYLAFAKSCSHLNDAYSDWERESQDDYERSKKILEALKKSEAATSKMIKKRYRFLAIRMAFYNGDHDQIQGIYKKSFGANPSDVIDYWALYFYATTKSTSAERNFDMARVFVYAPGKRFAALSRFSNKIPKDEVLALAMTDEEKATVHAMYAARNQGREMETIKTIHALNADHPLLDFLLVREVNKLEDWILTPRYTNFDPTMDPRGYRYEASQELIVERLKEDEQYGRELAKWMEKSANGSADWKLIEAYLKGITGNEKAALSILSKTNLLSEESRELASRLELLFRVKSNAKKALSSEDQQLLMNEKQDHYNLFLFAVAREYEFQDVLDVAAALFSHVNQNDDFYDGVTWRSGTGKQTLSSDYFYDWFLYLDAEYSVDEVQSVIDFAKSSSMKNGKFDEWTREYVTKDLDGLYDLLGTKYVRKNDMKTAISAFEKVKGPLWNEYPYKHYLNANPFYANFYSEHRQTEMDTIRYTKLELAKQYQEYLEKAENPETKNRSYYYFLVANCELNMSHYGNSWMMRRYFWTGAMNPNYLEDDDEFFRVKRAREMYMKAYDHATTKKEKALCLRMAGRCEKHDLMFDAPYSWDFDYDAHGGFLSYFYSKNTSYQRLEQQFPEDAEELLSNCYSFERYFAELKN